MPFEGAPPDSDSLPANTEAEQALIGTILINNAHLAAVAERLTAEHFASAVHGRIFAAAARLIERGSVANPVTLKSYFEHDGALEIIGGSRYLVKLADAAPTQLNTESYAEAVLECWRRRMLVGVADMIRERATKADINDLAMQQIEGAEAALETILAGVEGRKAGAGGMGAGDAATASLARSEAAYKGEGETGGIASGIEALDRLTGGFQPEDLIYIGKRPSMGGTALAVTLALNVARAGHPVLFCSVEMSAERIARRMLAQLTGISARNQRQGALSTGDWSQLLAAQRELAELPLVIDDTAPVGVGTIRRRAKQMARRGGLGLVLVDYLQLLRAGDGREDIPLRDSVPKVSAGLRELAKDEHVPVVALTQLSPAIDQRDNKRPLVSDTRWSHDAEQDAAVIMMLYREEYYLERAEPRSVPGGDQLKLDKLHAEWSRALSYSRGRAELIVCKAREDAVGTAHLAFDAPRSLFTDLSEDQGRFW